MQQVIIFEKDDGFLSVLNIPQDMLDKKVFLTDIGTKDVPEGKPFKIVDSSEIPSDKATRDTWKWEGDLSEDNDGFGTKVLPEGF